MRLRVLTCAHIFIRVPPVTPRAHTHAYVLVCVYIYIHALLLASGAQGVNWRLFKKLWPIGGMYTTMAGLTFDASGAALTFGVVFSAGSLPVSKTGTIYFMNFTAVNADGTMDSELATAIAKLDGEDSSARRRQSNNMIQRGGHGREGTNAGDQDSVDTRSKAAEQRVGLMQPLTQPGTSENKTLRIPFPAGPASSLPDIDGTAFPPYRIVFQPGECTRNDGGLHPLPPSPAPPPSPPPPRPPGQCTVHLHHTEGCFNYSDWKQGTAGPVFPLYEPSVDDGKLTLEACGLACFKSGLPSFAGVVGGDRCFCGTAADLTSAAAQARTLPKATCETVPCKGNPGQERGCGGVGRMLAFAYTCDKGPATSIGADAAHNSSSSSISTLAADRDASSPFGSTTLIDVDKTCFSCYRIPTFLAGQTPGVLHAFAEGRRTEWEGSFKQYTGSGAGGCTYMVHGVCMCRACLSTYCQIAPPSLFWLLTSMQTRVYSLKEKKTIGKEKKRGNKKLNNSVCARARVCVRVRVSRRVLAALSTSAFNPTTSRLCMHMPTSHRP